MAKKVQTEGPARKVWAVARIFLGLTFLWAFFDKLLGLGYSTCRDKTTDVVSTMCEKAWINGGSPTYGFLKSGSNGPLADFYQGLASTNPNSLVNWLFMLGLLGIGVGLTFGIAMKLSAYAGALMLILMWSAAMKIANNPVLDDHIIYAVVLIGLYRVNHYQYFGLRSWWINTELVKKYPILE